MISNYTNSTETSGYEPPGVPQYILKHDLKIEIKKL